MWTYGHPGRLQKAQFWQADAARRWCWFTTRPLERDKARQLRVLSTMIMRSTTGSRTTCKPWPRSYGCRVDARMILKVRLQLTEAVNRILAVIHSEFRRAAGTIR